MKKTIDSEPLEFKFTSEYQQHPQAHYQSNSLLKILVNKQRWISLYAYIQAQGEHYIYYREALSCAENTGRQKSLSVYFYKQYIQHLQPHQREERYRANEIEDASDLYFYLTRIFANEFKELMPYAHPSSTPYLFHIVPLKKTITRIPDISTKIIASPLVQNSICPQ